MISVDEDALTCDMAEYYHILNWRELSPHTVATLACGLSPDSRIKMIIGGRTATQGQLLQAMIVDRLTALLRMLGGKKGKFRSLAEGLSKGQRQKDKPALRKFSSLEEFERAYRKTVGGGG